MAKEIFGEIKKANDKYTIIASTANPDRDDEIILPSAFKNLGAYLGTNPVILWAHDYRVPPVAKAVSGKIKDNMLLLDIEFAETDFGKEVKYLYDNGFMNSFSVGFIPKEWDRDPDGRLVFTDVELLETSAVPVPANAQANIIRSVKGMGMDLPNISKLFGANDDQTPRPDGVKEKEVEKRSDKIKRIYGDLRNE